MNTQTVASASQKQKTHQAISNNVLAANRKTSTNYYLSDSILRHYVNKHISRRGRAYMQPKYHEMGKWAAGILHELSMLADHKSPELVKRNPYGETINEIRFHPAYWQMFDMVARSELFYVKWQPDLRQQFQHETHSMSFVLSQLYAMSEMGQFCPVAMTDGVARLIDRYGSEEDKQRLLPGLSAKSGDRLLTGAMFLTEKSGGSDVGRNMVSATHIEGDLYYLNGEKWFCSNVNADVIFVLARTDASVGGTRGLSIFLVEKYLLDGRRNPIDIVRIKDKLGVRSMASGECILQNTVGKRYGVEGEGMKIMLDMIGLMRLYNSVGALAGERRALVEAYQHLCYRTTFGKNALQHALIRQKLWELGSLYVADFYLVWRANQALDHADLGDEKEQLRFRLLTPMVKYWSGKNTVYIVRECMELMGGMGYIEDLVMPKLFRDVLVLPIWEGAGNIMILDMLRAVYRSPQSLKLLFSDIREATAFSENENLKCLLINELLCLQKIAQQLLTLDKDVQETTAKPFFERLIVLYQIILLIQQKDNVSEKWISLALRFLVKQLACKGEVRVQTPPSMEEVVDLLGWEFR